MGRKILALYLIAALLGVVTGILACAFQWLIAVLDEALTHVYSFLAQHGWSVALSSAVISMLMVYVAWFLVIRFAPEASGSGVPEIEGALLHERPVHWKRLLGVKFFAGVLSLSAKMVLGREGPTIQMGGNLGKMLADLFHLSLRRTDSLIAAGSAAGLAAAFNAPLAGVLFVMEEMRNQFNYSFTSFKVVIIACVSATMTLHALYGSGPAIQMDALPLPSLQSLWFFLLFGLIVGFVGLLFNKALMGIVSFLSPLSFQYRLAYVIAAGFLVGILAYYYPSSVGSGYQIINQALTMSPAFSSLCLLLVARFFTTMLSYSTGVPGGFFAPMLALGTILGLAAFHVLHYIFPELTILPGMFAVAGMGALFASSVRSPITGVVLVVEMTQNYSLILPLMITCITATTVMQLANNAPIYTQLLHYTLRSSAKNKAVRHD